MVRRASIQILRNCREAIPADGRVLVVEPSVPPGNEPSPAKDMDVQMLVYPGGMERTEDEDRTCSKKRVSNSAASRRRHSRSA
ncbi:MAG: hypothetical protein IH936_13215 [Acidobacteria bacterium]|nr:hypothetical protein [Acidobacteriota bacterium]